MSGWQRPDEAAFGIIYRAIMVPSILMAASDHPETPMKTAVLPFGSVLAIIFAKAFAETIAHALGSGAIRLARGLSRNSKTVLQ